MKRISLLKHFIPSGYPLVAVILAIMIAVAGIVVAILYGLFQQTLATGKAFAMFGLFFLGFAALIIDIGAWIEKRAAPRLTMGCGAVLMMMVSWGVFIASLYWFPIEEEINDAILGVTCLALPFLFIFAVPALLALPRVQKDVQAFAQQGQEQRVVEILSSRGIATFAELSGALGISEDDVDGLLRDLMQEGKIEGVREIEHKRFYTRTKFDEKQLLLLGMIAAQGQIKVEDAAVELGAPVGLLKTWIYNLVQEGKFTGYINWDKGVLYSANAEKLREGERCPHCGGTLKTAGKGTIQCHHCGTEIFI
ncbi:MAG: hypothetical protein JXB07_19205 [Anaerolineae bacterium]|nr:hypothetical protein [Anaerolineae bacterium]